MIFLYFIHFQLFGNQSDINNISEVIQLIHFTLFIFIYMFVYIHFYLNNEIRFYLDS